MVRQRLLPLAAAPTSQSFYRELTDLRLMLKTNFLVYEVRYLYALQAMTFTFSRIASHYVQHISQIDSIIGFVKAGLRHYSVTDTRETGFHLRVLRLIETNST